MAIQSERFVVERSTKIDKAWASSSYPFWYIAEETWNNVQVNPDFYKLWNKLKNERTTV